MSEIFCTFADEMGNPDKAALFAAISDYKSHIYGLTDGERLILYNTPNPISQRHIIKIYNEHTSDKQYTVVSDNSKLYSRWKALTGDDILINQHSLNRYKVNGHSSNAIEGVFSHLKRNLVSGYVRPSKRLLQLYLNEFVWRWNVRTMSPKDKLSTWLRTMMTNRITMTQLKEYDSTSDYKTGRQEISDDDITRIVTSSIVRSIEVRSHRYSRKNVGAFSDKNAK